MEKTSLLQAKASFLDKIFEASHWLADAFHEQNAGAGLSESIKMGLLPDDKFVNETCSPKLKPGYNIFCVIPYKDYQNIVQKLEKERKYHKNALLQATHYKVSRDGYKIEYEKSRNRWEHSKELIKSWQDYHDEQQRRSSSGRNPNLDCFIHKRVSTTSPKSLPTPPRGSASSATSLDPTSFRNVQDVLAKEVNIPSALTLLPGCQSSISEGFQNDQISPSLHRSPSQAENVNLLPYKLSRKPLVEDSQGSDDLLEEDNYNGIERACSAHVKAFDEKESLINKGASTPTRGLGDLGIGTSRLRVSPDLEIPCSSRATLGDLSYLLPPDYASAAGEPKLDSDDGHELLGAGQTKNLTSSQSTEDEVEPGDIIGKSSKMIETDLSSDPVVLSSRSLKRKRGRAVVQPECQGVSNLHQYHDGSDHKPITIKDENSSSPIGAATLPSLPQQSSIDLDDYRAIVASPAKRRQLQRMISRGVSHMLSTPSGYESASTMPPDAQRSDGLSKSFVEQLNQHSPNGLRIRDRFDKVEKENFEETRSYVWPYKRGNEQREASGAQEGGTDYKQTVLQALSVNKRILPRTGATKSRHNRRYHKGATFVGEVAEDGERYAYEKGQRNIIGIANSTNGICKKVLHPAPSPTSKARQINTLLETSSPAKHVLLPSEGKLAPSSSPQRKFRQTRATTNNKLGRQTDELEAKSNQVQPEHEPLRVRPLWRLGLDDFKINPKLNQGYGFAFSEVVRNREQRHCLPGCTRPECCGNQFQKMIELGGPLQNRSMGIWDSTQGDDDQRLLEEYLGDDISRVERMNLKEKTETLTKARAQQLAQRHGKHREVFQRSSTPPGFWRADMPTTQETAQDKERSKQMERQKVGERFVEAMKTNGRWLFRDE